MTEPDSSPSDTEHGPPIEEDLEIREPPRILVPVAVLKGQQVAEPLVEFLAAADVVLLGYHVIPEQTPAEQASMQYEERAKDAVEGIAHVFEAAGREVETRVVFTHDRDQTIDRVASEVSATAVLLPNPAGEIQNVLVPMRGAVDVDRMADLVATLLAGRTGSVTLLGLSQEDGGFAADQAVEHVRQTLLDRGFDPEHVLTDTTVSDMAVRTIAERAADYDVIVMGEGGPSLLTTLFGDTAERVAEESLGPVLVVRAGEDVEEERGTEDGEHT
jgi:nucleotide-binding universal stress UspA family protein